MGQSPGMPTWRGDHYRPAASRSGLEGLPLGWPCPVSWPGSVGDWHEGPQVANRIHRTASIGQRRTATGDPQITMSKPELERAVCRQVVAGPRNHL